MLIKITIFHENVSEKLAGLLREQYYKELPYMSDVLRLPNDAHVV